MRKVARYAFNVAVESVSDAADLWSQLQQRVEAWIDTKGLRDEKDGAITVTYRGGRIADLRVVSMVIDERAMLSWSLEEPSNGGVFATAIRVARDEKVIAVACELAAGAPAQLIAPVSFDAHCPNVLREIIDLNAPWCVGDVVLNTKPIRFDGADGGRNLASLISCRSRSLPLIVVSEYERFLLHPGVAEDIAHDLCGLAIVAVATDSASWEITNTLGAEWSCYHGAIRLYWPLHAVTHSPHRHPLWTSRRLLYGVPGTKEAAQRIRAQFRRRILGLSTLTMRPHPVFEEVSQAHRAKLLDERRHQAATDKEWINLLEAQNADLEEATRNLSARVNRLETDLANAQVILQWAARDTEEEVQPDADVPPASVAEAVKRAKQLYSGVVVFGNDVTGGVNALANDAGPPGKVLNYLAGLAQLVEARRNGPLGASMVQWLKDRGYDASGESDTIRNSKTEMKKRIFHDGSACRKFELHLKPNDATSPERCVRIYFDWDDAAKAVVVGWVGRHL